MVKSTVEKLGALDIALNNAGINASSPAEETSGKEWSSTFNVNTHGVFYGCQAEARHMLSIGCGKIINTGSMASLPGYVPNPQKQAAYNASKAAVVKLTQVWFSTAMPSLDQHACLGSRPPLPPSSQAFKFASGFSRWLEHLLLQLSNGGCPAAFCCIVQRQLDSPALSTIGLKVLSCNKGTSCSRSCEPVSPMHMPSEAGLNGPHS